MLLLHRSGCYNGVLLLIHLVKYYINLKSYAPTVIVYNLLVSFSMYYYVVCAKNVRTSPNHTGICYSHIVGRFNTELINPTLLYS